MDLKAQKWISLILTILHFYLGQLVHAEEHAFLALPSQGNKTQAQKRCAAKGQLAMPMNRQENEALKSVMGRYHLNSTWLGAEMVKTYWHHTKDGRLLHDQGCYLDADVTLTDSVRPIMPEVVSNCGQYCRDNNFTLMALKRQEVTGSSGLSCSCVAAFSMQNQQPEGKCAALCNSGSESCGIQETGTVRIMTTASEPEADYSWSKTGSAHFLGRCSLYGGKNDIRPWRCNDIAYAYCAKPDGVAFVKEQEVTWHESRRICDSQGASITPVGIGWTDVASWRWSNSSAPPFFGQWEEGQPDFSEGECISFGLNGGWKINDCKHILPIVCKIQGESPERGEGVNRVAISGVSSGLGVSAALSLSFILCKFLKSRRSAVSHSIQKTPSESCNNVALADATSSAQAVEVVQHGAPKNIRKNTTGLLKDFDLNAESEENNEENRFQLEDRLAGYNIIANLDHRQELDTIEGTYFTPLNSSSSSNQTTPDTSKQNYSFNSPKSPAPGQDGVEVDNDGLNVTPPPGTTKEHGCFYLNPVDIQPSSDRANIGSPKEKYFTPLNVPPFLSDQEASETPDEGFTPLNILPSPAEETGDKSNRAQNTLRNLISTNNQISTVPRPSFTKAMPTLSEKIYFTPLRLPSPSDQECAVLLSLPSLPDQASHFPQKNANFTYVHLPPSSVQDMHDSPEEACVTSTSSTSSSSQTKPKESGPMTAPSVKVNPSPDQAAPD